jgi:hypothetical protein
MSEADSVATAVAWEFRQRSAVGDGPQRNAKWCDWCSIDRETYDRFLREPNELIQARALYAIPDAAQARIAELEEQLSRSCDETRFADSDAGCTRAVLAESRIKELEEHIRGLETALAPFAAVARVVEFYAEDAMPEMIFPRPECESKYSDEPRCVRLYPNDFISAAAALRKDQSNG